jgi:GntR family transcriptional regulator
LDLVAGDTVVVLERVRTADDRPVVWSRDVVRATLLPAGALEPAGDVSVYDVLARNDVAVQHGVVTVEPQVADKALAKRLRIEPGALILYLRQVDYDASGEPVLLSHEHHVADAFEFSVVRRGPGGGAR